MKILIIAGFLGAGKTTFIKALSQKQKRDFCILENEYAQADMDKTILSQDSSLNIWEMTENCICCSGKQDFASTVLTIANTIDPEYLIVEPTGAARLSSILENIKKITYERITLLKPVTILDPASFDRYQKEFSDIYIDQIQHSDCILLSKTESANSLELAQIVHKIHALNPKAAVIDKHYSRQPEGWWQSLLEQYYDESVAEKVRQMQESEKEAESRLEQLSLADVSEPTPVHLISALEMISFGVLGNIVRAKGLLPCGNQWLMFDYADRTYSITGSNLSEDAKAVFIGRDLNREGLRRLFQGEMFVQFPVRRRKSKAGADDLSVPPMLT